MSRNIGLICQRDVVTIREADDLTAAAQRMREKHVGYLILETLAEELGNIAGTIRSEQRAESALRT